VGIIILDENNNNLLRIMKFESKTDITEPVALLDQRETKPLSSNYGHMLIKKKGTNGNI